MCECVCLLSRVRLFATTWIAAPQAPLSMGFSRQEYWRELPFPSPGDLPNPGTETKSPALASRSFTTEPSPSLSISSVAVESDSLRPHGVQHTRLPCPSPTPGTCSNSCLSLVMPSNHILCRPVSLLLSSPLAPSAMLSIYHQGAGAPHLPLHSFPALRSPGKLLGREATCHFF